MPGGLRRVGEEAARHRGGWRPGGHDFSFACPPTQAGPGILALLRGARWGPVKVGRGHEQPGSSCGLGAPVRDLPHPLTER